MTNNLQPKTINQVFASLLAQFRRLSQAVRDSELFCHEMHLRDLFGGQFELNYRQLLWLLTHNVTLVFSGLVVLCLFAIDPHGYRTIFTIPIEISIWLASLVTLLSCKIVMFLFLALVALRLKPTRIYLPVFSMVEFMTTIYFVEALAKWLSGGRFTPGIVSSAPYYLMTFLVIELFFVRFVMPQIFNNPALVTGPPDTAGHSPIATVRHDGPLENPPLAPQMQAIVQIADRRIRLDNILHVQSEEHYLTVTLRSGSFTSRAKLTEFISQTNAADGIQPHRS